MTVRSEAGPPLEGSRRRLNSGSGSPAECSRDSGGRSCSKDSERQSGIDCEWDDGFQYCRGLNSSRSKGGWRNTMRVDQGSPAGCGSQTNEGGGRGRQGGERGVHLPANQAADTGLHPGSEGGNGRPSQSHKLMVPPRTEEFRPKEQRDYGQCVRRGAKALHSRRTIDEQRDACDKQSQGDI